MDICLACSFGFDTEDLVAQAVARFRSISWDVLQDHRDIITNVGSQLLSTLYELVAGMPAESVDSVVNFDLASHCRTCTSLQATCASFWCPLGLGGAFRRTNAEMYDFSSPCLLAQCDRFLSDSLFPSCINVLRVPYHVHQAAIYHRSVHRCGSCASERVVH